MKLAEGHLDTHSKKVTMNKEFIQDIAHRTGCNEDVLTAIRNMNLARELWDIIPAEKLETFSKLLTEHCKQCCAPLLPDGELTIFINRRRRKEYMYEKGIDDNVHGSCRIDRTGTISSLAFMQRRGIGTSRLYGKHSGSDTQIACKAGIGAEYALNKTWALRSALDLYP